MTLRASGEFKSATTTRLFIHFPQFSIRISIFTLLSSSYLAIMISMFICLVFFAVVVDCRSSGQIAVDSDQVDTLSDFFLKFLEISTPLYPRWFLVRVPFDRFLGRFKEWCRLLGVGQSRPCQKSSRWRYWRLPSRSWIQVIFSNVCCNYAFVDFNFSSFGRCFHVFLLIFDVVPCVRVDHLCVDLCSCLHVWTLLIFDVSVDLWWFWLTFVAHCTSVCF